MLVRRVLWSIPSWLSQVTCLLCAVSILALPTAHLLCVVGRLMHLLLLLFKTIAQLS